MSEGISPNDPFFFARDHDRDAELGSSAWCVLGPHGFHLPLDDLWLATAMALLLSGKPETAGELASKWVQMHERQSARLKHHHEGGR